MAEDFVITITNNQGNDIYAMVSRDFITSPIKSDKIRIILENEAQLLNIIKIRNEKSFGSASNRDISLKNYVTALNKTNLILDIPLDPPLVIDGQTFFETDIEAQSEIDLLFYYDQKEIGDIL